MTYLDELDLSLRTIEGAKHSVDAIAGVAVNAPHAPRVQAINQKVTDGRGHESVSKKRTMW
jgi:hypothetical protein